MKDTFYFKIRMCLCLHFWSYQTQKKSDNVMEEERFLFEKSLWQVELVRVSSHIPKTKKNVLEIP